LPKSDDTTTLVLDRSVALVLFDFLSRTTDEEGGEPLVGAVENEAELPALWSLLTTLEDNLTEAFADDYQDRVRWARAAVIERFGHAPS
jgi:hypothetical protein